MGQHVLGSSLNQGLIDWLIHWYRQLRRSYVRRKFPYAFAFNQRVMDWDVWYQDRHEWIQDNIDHADRWVWLDCDVVTYVDRFTMPESWVQGSLRFRRSDDLTYFMLRWSE